MSTTTFSARMMSLLFWILILAVGGVEAVYWQKLTCPHELMNDSLLRVWCRRSSTDCCSGFTFSQSDRSVDGGNLRVTQQGSVSFTVAVLRPSHGEGVYWCGVLGGNNTIIKLAEGYFHSSSGDHIWSFTRWILLPLLPMVTILITLYSRTITKHTSKEEELYEDIAVSREPADPQYEDAASVCELE